MKIYGFILLIDFPDIWTIPAIWFILGGQNRVPYNRELVYLFSSKILIGPIEKGKRCTGGADCSSVPLYCNTLLFVNILVSGTFDGYFAQRLEVNKPPKHLH